MYTVTVLSLSNVDMVLALFTLIIRGWLCILIVHNICNFDAVQVVSTCCMLFIFIVTIGVYIVNSVVYVAYIIGNQIFFLYQDGFGTGILRAVIFIG